MTKEEAIAKAYDALKDIGNADDNRQPYTGEELQDIVQPIISGLGPYLPAAHEDAAAFDVKPEREPMQCPFCKKGTLSVRSDAYTYRALYDITVENRPRDPKDPSKGTYPWTEMVMGEIEDTHEYQDYSVICDNCDLGEEGNVSEDDVLEKIAENEEEDEAVPLAENDAD
jgi:hypothetical protein